MLLLYLLYVTAFSDKNHNFQSDRIPSMCLCVLIMIRLPLPTLCLCLHSLYTVLKNKPQATQAKPHKLEPSSSSVPLVKAEK